MFAHVRMSIAAAGVAAASSLFAVGGFDAALRAAEPQRASDATRDAAEEVQEAVAGWQRVMRTAETAVPASVLARAQAVAVFSNVVQAAFIAGGRGGDGVITAHRGGAWTPPAFFKLGGASIGAQIGGRRTDIVLVFTTRDAVEALLDDRLEFGAEVTAVAGPNAKTAASEANTTDKGLLVYTRDRGLFAGASMEGTVITPHNDLNRDIYGTTARGLLTGEAPTIKTEIGQPFLKALARSLKGT